MQALILAGGKGTRLCELTKNEIPKPMVKMLGKPLLEYAIDRLKENGITDIFISIGHLHEKIEDYFGDGKNFGVNITYLCENEPLGSGGALYYLKGKVESDFVICSADAIFDINIKRMYDFHKSKHSLITLFAHPNLHPYDSDLIITDENDCVKEINLKNSKRDFYYNNLVNAGFFIVNPKALEYFTELKKVNLEHDFVNYFVPQKCVFAYKSSEYIKDVGTVERFNLASKDLQNNIVLHKNLKYKQKAIFLDRDGTINVYKGFITNSKDIELLPTVTDAIKKINESEYLAIIVSNQPVIARGEASKDDVNECFKKIETLLGEKGAYIDGIYYCPHHPHSGFLGEVKELKINCECRKPKIGLIKKAQKDFNLGLDMCYIIGDTSVDIETGKNANIKTILVKTGKNEEKTVESNYVASNLLDAVNFVLGDKKWNKEHWI